MLKSQFSLATPSTISQKNEWILAFLALMVKSRGLRHQSIFIILKPSETEAAQALIMSSPWRNAFIQASAKAVAWAAHFGQASADQPATWVRLAMPGGIPGIGVSWNGESPIAGWFIIENPSING